MAYLRGFLFCLFFLLSIAGIGKGMRTALSVNPAEQSHSGECVSKKAGLTEEPGQYILVVEGFDWGPAVSKVILYMEQEVGSVKPADFTVKVRRKARCRELEEKYSKGIRKVIGAYPSDENGSRQIKGRFVTLELEIAPHLIISNPFDYASANGCEGNNWVDYKMSIEDLVDGDTWTSEKGRIMPLVNTFDLDGRYTYKDELEMSFAHYSPPVDDKTNPLIIWLHGGGEGGSDTTIPLLANRAANYASREIQGYFGGAYVLVPQCPGAWMHNREGIATWGEENDVYNEALMDLIKEFVSAHPDIDTSRIYVGGCSNGGYMSLKLILLRPDYFAAGFISALAYKSEYLTDDQIKSITHVPIWFIHSKDDTTTRPEQTVVPVYQRLKRQGAENVHFSYFDHVVDISGKYGGEQFHYPGHWSWIYSHANKCRLDFDGTPVSLNGVEVSLMEWMSSQARE